MGVPYAIIKGKARLGQLVDKKTATAVALKSVTKADEGEFSTIARLLTEKYTGDAADRLRRKWGGNKLGPKARAARAKTAKELQRAKSKSAAASKQTEQSN